MQHITQPNIYSPLTLPTPQFLWQRKELKKDAMIHAFVNETP